MNASDAVLVVARHETGPLMAKEALACDVPVVSLDVGDVSEWIDGLPGCALVRSDDPQAIAEGLDRVLEHEPVDLRSRISGVSLERVALRVRDVYERVLNDA